MLLCSTIQGGVTVWSTTWQFQFTFLVNQIDLLIIYIYIYIYIIHIIYTTYIL
nr:MAG TPA: hypothetical protein [Caudoviricetes sp.]